MITSLEGPRSTPLTLDIGSDGRPRPLLSADSAPEPSASVAAPSTVCATETPTECFTVTVIARDLAPVRRLLPLPDGRLLVLLVSGAVTILPSGTSERPEFGSSGAGLIVDVVDVAADPDFGVNRFLYLRHDGYGNGRAPHRQRRPGAGARRSGRRAGDGRGGSPSRPG